MPGMHPSVHARSKPDTPAIIIADTGESLTYCELDEGSNRFAHLMRSIGLKPGDRIGVVGPGGGGLVEAEWYLFAGDETALPAIGRMLEHLPATAKGTASQTKSQR